MKLYVIFFMADLIKCGADVNGEDFHCGNLWPCRRSRDGFILNERQDAGDFLASTIVQRTDDELATPRRI